MVSTVKVNLSGECLTSTASLSSGDLLKSSNVYMHSLQNMHADTSVITTAPECSSIAKTSVGQQSTRATFCSSVY